MSERPIFQASSSVAALLERMDGLLGYQLLLVQKQSTGKWGVPAGGTQEILDPQTGEQRLETSTEALMREIPEETGIDPKFFYRPELVGALLLKHPTKDKYSLGYIFNISIRENFKQKLLPKDIGEIADVKFFKSDELLELIDECKENIYRPDFNIGLIKWWMRNRWTHDNLDVPRYSDGIIDENLIKRLQELEDWY